SMTNGQSNFIVIGEPTGFASLDVNILANSGEYQEYNFSMPGRDLEITSHPVSTFLSTRLVGIAWLAAIVAAAWVLTRRGVRSSLLVLVRSPFVGLLLIAVGVTALVTHVLPMAG